VKIDARNELNKTLVYLSCQNGHVDIVREFRATEAPSQMRTRMVYSTPLHQACTNGHTGVAKVLVDEDAEVEARCVCMCVGVVTGG